MANITPTNSLTARTNQNSFGQNARPSSANSQVQALGRNQSLDSFARSHNTTVGQLFRDNRNLTYASNSGTSILVRQQSSTNASAPVSTVAPNTNSSSLNALRAQTPMIARAQKTPPLTDSERKSLQPLSPVYTGSKGADVGAARGRGIENSKEIRGLTTYRENAGPWTKQAYSFGGSNSLDRENSIGRIGCTLTAVTNATSVPPKGKIWGFNATPGNTNVRGATGEVIGANGKKQIVQKSDGGIWDIANSRTKWTNLINKNRSTNNPGDVFGVERGVSINSPSGQRLLKDIRNEVEAGRPVVLGMSGHSAGGVRHSVLVTGVIPGKSGADALIVRDNWRGPNDDRDYIEKPTRDQQISYKTTLAETLQAYPGSNGPGKWTKIDKAMSAQPRGHATEKL